MEFRKSRLPNGVRVLTEKHLTSRAVSCGIWINRGTRDESAAEAGLAHFIEHMVFKRTAKRTAYEISRDMEAVGGDLNAFTSRENTCFVTHSLRADVGLSLDILSDLVAKPLFDSQDIRKEKQVVVQEIHMAEDQLEEHIFDKYFEYAYPDNPLGRPILGSVKSIEGMKRDQVLDFHGRCYKPENILVSVAGNIEHEEIVALVMKYLKLPNVRRAPEMKTRHAAELKPFREVIKRPSEQAHILMGFPSSDFRSGRRFEAYIVNSLLGGGMTSRLYQTVREEKGLVYSIFSSLATFVDAGTMLVYAGTEPTKAPTVVELALKEIRRIKREGIKKSELRFFQKQVTGQVLLGADDIESRMNSLAVNELVNGRYRSVDDVLRDIESVTWESVHEYIETYFDLDRLGMLLMGPLPEAPTKKWLESL